jgi:hypothetical protein
MHGEMESNSRGPRQNEAVLSRRKWEKFHQEYPYEEIRRTGPTTDGYHNAMHNPHSPRNTNGQIRQTRSTHPTAHTQGTPHRPKGTQGNISMPSLSTQRALRQKLPHQMEGAKSHSPYHHPHRHRH